MFGGRAIRLVVWVTNRDAGRESRYEVSMEFGRISYFPRVDYRLGESHTLFKNEGGLPRNFRLDVGAPLWTQPGWVGTFLPKGTKSKDFLSLYSRRLPAVELNATHYAVPAPAQVQNWAQAVADGFHFYPKFPQEISHRLIPSGKIREARLMTIQFFKALEKMGDRLGCTFLQMPPDFAAAGLKNLQAFTQGWPAEVSLCIEFRSAYCFENRQLRPEFAEFLASNGFGTVVTDTPGRRDVCHGTLTAPFVVVRFVGHELHSTDFQRIDSWVQRLLEWRSLGVRQVGFFIHQPDEISSPELCDYLIRGMNRGGGLGLTSWKDIPEPGQIKLL
jgi:uncharacterized protein YecE (DUF72 family)